MKVSIVVPVYNTKKYLERCVQSLLCQTLLDIQIILVDDGSDDGSGEMCEQYKRTDPRIKVIHKENQGLGFARNTGMEAAEGEFIAFVDSDDYIDPQMYEKLYEAAMRYEADMVLSGAKYIGGETFIKENQIELKHCFEREESFKGEEGRKKLMLGIAGALPKETEDSRYGFACWKNLYRNSVIRDENIKFVSEREISSEDVIFHMDYIPHIKNAVGIPGAWYNYCRNSTSLTKGYREDRYVRCRHMIQAVEQRMSDVMEEREYQPYTDRQLQAYARVCLTQLCVYARESRMPEKERVRKAVKICRDSKLQEVLKRYPYWKLPLKQAIFAFTMRYKLVRMQKVLVGLRSQI